MTAPKVLAKGRTKKGWWMKEIESIDYNAASPSGFAIVGKPVWLSKIENLADGDALFFRAMIPNANGDEVFVLKVDSDCVSMLPDGKGKMMQVSGVQILEGFSTMAEAFAWCKQRGIPQT